MPPNAPPNSRFQILHEVGRGGMGVVFAAFDRVTGEQVALKRMLRPDHEAARFLHEATTLARVSHTHIVRYVAHGVDAAGPWLAMEWLDGTDLAASLEAGRLSPALGLAIVAQVAEGVAAAHAAGIVHRDLKPSNVFLLKGAQLQVKVVDFGIARSLDAKTVLTASGTMLGTPLYMAPEQLRALPASFASDVHALASITFEVLTGAAPFVAETYFATIGRIVLEEAPRLDSLVDVRSDLADLVAEAFSKDPEVRPTSDTMAKVLRRYVEDFAIGATVLVKAKPAAVADLSRERRACVAMVVRGFEDIAYGGEQRASVRQAIVEAAAATEILADGSIVALFVAHDAQGADGTIWRATRLARDLCGRFSSLVMLLAGAHMEAGATYSTATSIEGWLFARVGAMGANLPGVHVDIDSAALLARRFQLADHGSFVTICGEIDTDEQRLLGRITPTVGRDAEIAQLVAVVRAVHEEAQPRLAMVIGAAGHGKTRLRHAVGVELARSGMQGTEFVARFEPGGEDTNWSGFKRGLRAAVGIMSGEAATDGRKALGRFVGGLDAASTSLLAYLASVSDTADEGIVRLARDAPDRLSEAILRAFIAFVKIRSRDYPMVLWVEDAHCADKASLGLIDALCGESDLGIALMMFGRPELLDRAVLLTTRRRPTLLHLGALSPRAVRKLAQTILPSETEEDTYTQLVALAAGSPLVVEELLRAYVRDGKLTPSSSARAVFEARVAALPPGDRLIARAASIADEVFWDDQIVALLQDSTLDVNVCITSLLGDEFFVQRPNSQYPGTRELSFRHALLRDAAREMVPEDLACSLHAGVARWLSAHNEPDFARVAHHAELGQLSSLAANMWKAAGEAALAVGDLAGGILMLERVVRADKVGRTESQHAGLHLALEDAYRDQQSMVRRLRHLASYRQYAAKGTHLRTCTLAMSRTARWYCDQQNYRVALELAELTLRLANTVETVDVAAEALVTAITSSEHAFSNARLDALDRLLATESTQRTSGESTTLAIQPQWIREITQLAPRIPVVLRLELLWARGVMLRRWGRVGAAVESYRAAIQIFEQLGLKTSRAATISNALGYALLVQGRVSEARRCFADTLAMLEQQGIRRVVSRVTTNLANAELACGNLAAALNYVDIALERHKSFGDLHGLADTLLVRVHIQLLRGDLVDAERTLLQAQPQCSQNRYDLVHESLVSTWLYAARGDDTKSLAIAQRGLTLAITPTGDSPFRALTVALQAEVALCQYRLGRRREAIANVIVALDQLAEMDASEFGVETFAAILQVLEHEADLPALDARRRALAYVHELRRYVPAQALDDFESRADVTTIRRLTADKPHEETSM